MEHSKQENQNEGRASNPSHRRNFLKTGIAAATGMALLPSFGEVSSHQKNLMSSSKNLVKQDDEFPGTRKLGGKLQVSSIGLGCQEMSGNFYGVPTTREEMIRLVRIAYDHGVTLFDCAEAYGPFEVEKIVGEAVAPFRDKVVIETKFGWNIDQKTGQQLGGLSSRPQHIKAVVENMLKRLRTDRIDLLYQHRVDPAVPIEDVAGVVKDLIKEGKVLHWGLSEPGPQTVRRAHAIHPLTAIQNEHSVLYRGSEKDIFPLCEEFGISLVCFVPLAQGFLAGAIDENTRFGANDFRRMSPRLQPEALKKNIALVDVVKSWAKRKETTCAQLSLAWLLAQKPWIVPIPGTTKTRHLLENIGADEVRFTSDEFEKFTSEIAAVKIEGQRSSESVMKMSGVEAPAKKN